MYNFTLPSISAPDEVRGQRHATAVFSHGKEKIFILLGVGLAPGPVWTGSPPPGIDPRTVHAVACRYTGFAIHVP
jgi:hypothetical protein